MRYRTTASEVERRRAKSRRTAGNRNTWFSHHEAPNVHCHREVSNDRERSRAAPSEVEAYDPTAQKRAPKVLTLTTLTADDWQLWRELRLQALREAPYAFGSTLGEWQGTGDTEQRWRNRLSSVPFNVIASSNGEPCGMVSALLADAPQTAELISMWVAPSARGRGVGNALIEKVLDWAKRQNALRVVLAVREYNEHAIALYARNGFVDTDPAALQHDDECERVMVCSLLA